MADSNLQPPCRQKQQARSLGICSMHDNSWHDAKLCIIFYIFQCYIGSACEWYKILNARARLIQYTSALSNAC